MKIQQIIETLGRLAAAASAARLRRGATAARGIARAGRKSALNGRDCMGIRNLLVNDTVGELDEGAYGWRWRGRGDRASGGIAEAAAKGCVAAKTDQMRPQLAGIFRGEAQAAA